MTPAELINAMHLPLVLVGTDELVLAANEPAQALFGMAMQGRHYITVLRQPVVLDSIETALNSGQRTEAQVAMRGETGEATYRISVAPLAGEGVLLSMEDISHVQEAGQMRRDFVANVSHELRSPLTALAGFIETLKGPARDDPEAQARFLDIMGQEAGRMNRLIQDLLSLSRVEAEERKRPRGQADINALVATAATTLEAQASAAAVSVSIDAADDLPVIPGDPDQLLQVFSNLIENAVKYGRDAVSVTVETRDRDPSLRAASVRVKVADNGEGIDPIHLTRLTERFYRIDDHRSRELGGTGLGLAIVKHIVNRHRGRLKIESVVGQGSRFTVILPVSDPAL